MYPWEEVTLLVPLSEDYLLHLGLLVGPLLVETLFQAVEPLLAARHCPTSHHHLPLKAVVLLLAAHHLPMKAVVLLMAAQHLPLKAEVLLKVAGRLQMQLVQPYWAASVTLLLLLEEPCLAERCYWAVPLRLVRRQRLVEAPCSRGCYYHQAEPWMERPPQKR